MARDWYLLRRIMMNLRRTWKNDELRITYQTCGACDFWLLLGMAFQDLLVERRSVKYIVLFSYERD